MKLKDKVTLLFVFLFAFANYVIRFLLYSQSSELAKTAETPVYILTLVVLPFFLVWYALLIFRETITVYNKCFAIVLLLVSIGVFIVKETNPVFVGLRYLNTKVGGNDVLLLWANKIFELNLSQLTDEDYSKGGTLKVKEHLYENVFSDVDVSVITLLVKDDRKVIQIIYPGNGGVLIGDNDLIMQNRLVLYKDKNLYLYYSPK